MKIVFSPDKLSGLSKSGAGNHKHVLLLSRNQGLGDVTMVTVEALGINSSRASETIRDGRIFLMLHFFFVVHAI